MAELFSSTDMALARRIEAGHAHAAMASIQGLSKENIAGGWAIFHQVDSPVTQAIGIGMNGGVAPADLDRLEEFFHSRASPANIDLCTLADVSLREMIQARAYTVREISHVLARRLDPAEDLATVSPGIGVEAVAPPEFPSWLRMTVRGFTGEDEVPGEQVEMLASANPWPEAFFGLWGASRAATAAMDVHAGMATLFGDATLVHARGHGLHLALIRHRLLRAAQLGCDLATASVLPGSISHRNYERAGFQLVYARVMVSRPSVLLSS